METIETAKIPSVITLDFETYYDQKYSLKTLTTEEYVRDSQFEVIIVAVKVNDGEVQACSGTKEELQTFLAQFELHRNILLCHNTAFDGFILSHVFNLHPLRYADTMSMGRILHGVSESVSLENLSKIYYAGIKGNYVEKTKGKHRVDFSPQELEEFTDYCKGDVNLTWMLFNAMISELPVEELRLIDLTIKMYCKPRILIDTPLLQGHLKYLKQVKEELLTKAEVHKDVVMSNDKFATMLRLHGVTPPTKRSPTTGKETWAFAKTDEGFKALIAHENPAVQLLAAARLGNKSTLDETRTEKFIGIGGRGAFPFSVLYSGAAVTHRWSGFDVNPQNLPRGGVLRHSLIAPLNRLLIAGDLNAIELRIGLWLAEEEEQLQLLREGLDLYKKSAEEISGIPYDQVDKDTRFIFKTVNLAAIYGVGYEKLWRTLKLGGVEKNITEVQNIVNAYRMLRTNLVRTWKDGDRVLQAITSRETMEFGRKGLFKVVEGGILKPNGLVLKYPNLQRNADGFMYTVLDKKKLKWERLYGAKVFQRCVQSLARDLIAWQMLRVNKKIPVVGTVHDEIIGMIWEDEHVEAIQYMYDVMDMKPGWALDLPLAAAVGVGKNYGDCK